MTITYDAYYFCPRMWLAGVKDGGIPLTKEEILEDIMGDYANKTVTFETHPHLGTE